MTRRSQLFSLRKFSMSAMSASACAIFSVMGLTRVPSRRLTQLWSNTASIATTPSSSAEMGPRSRSSRTPAVRAASRALGLMGSQPPNTRSPRSAKGTNSRISGLRFSSRFPKRIWASWLSEPTGTAWPLREAITPAMKVEATAPIPGVRTPRRPVAGAMFTGLFMVERVGDS